MYNNAKIEGVNPTMEICVNGAILVNDKGQDIPLNDNTSEKKDPFKPFTKATETPQPKKEKRDWWAIWRELTKGAAFACHH